MLEIDGSYGEGGGQIIRSAIAHSAITGTPCKIINIRANRPNPGLAFQHITAIKAISKICNGIHSELTLGTRTFEFHPGKIKPGKFNFDIGTAGSITLVLQCCLLPAIFGEYEGEIKIKIQGGTDVNWSPQFDYFRLIFLKHLEKIGIKTDVKLIKRGYYPKGGGEVEIKVSPINKKNKMIFADRGKLNEISGVVHSRNLPSHVSKRILRAAKEKVEGYSPISIDTDDVNHSLSPGTGIVLCAEFECTTLGGSALGAKGIPAEQIGSEAADELINEINSGGAVDIYAADQLVPYLASLGGELSVQTLSQHTKTNIWLMERFIEKKFKINEQESLTKISF